MLNNYLDTLNVVLNVLRMLHATFICQLKSYYNRLSNKLVNYTSHNRKSTNDENRCHNERINDKNGFRDMNTILHKK